MSRVSATYRRLLRREVVDICLFIFIADVVTGVQTPVFPLYATSLGASLGLLGVITAVLGLTRLLSALPVGILSDRLDRKTVLVGGMVLFALSFICYAIAPSAAWLSAACRNVSQRIRTLRFCQRKRLRQEREAKIYCQRNLRRKPATRTRRLRKRKKLKNSLCCRAVYPAKPTKPL